MFKKLLLKLISEAELRKELAKRVFVNPLDVVYLKPEEIEEMWLKIFSENKLLSKWIQFRKNQLLHHLLASNDETTRNIVIGAISEWELIERMAQIQRENTYQQPYQSETNKDIDSILDKLKKVVLNKKESNASNEKG